MEYAYREGYIPPEVVEQAWNQKKNSGIVTHNFPRAPTFKEFPEKFHISKDNKIVVIRRDVGDSSYFVAWPRPEYMPIFQKASRLAGRPTDDAGPEGANPGAIGTLKVQRVGKDYIIQHLQTHAMSKGNPKLASDDYAVPRGVLTKHLGWYHRAIVLATNFAVKKGGKLIIPSDTRETASSAKMLSMHMKNAARIGGLKITLHRKGLAMHR